MGKLLVLLRPDGDSGYKIGAGVPGTLATVKIIENAKVSFYCALLGNDKDLYIPFEDTVAPDNISSSGNLILRAWVRRETDIVTGNVKIRLQYANLAPGDDRLSAPLTSIAYQTPTVQTTLHKEQAVDFLVDLASISISADNTLMIQADRKSDGDAADTFSGDVSITRVDVIYPTDDVITNILDVKDSVSTTSTSNITLSGEQTLNGFTTLTSRVGVVGQTDPTENGIYVSAAGAWARSTDADEDAEVTNGLAFFVSGSSSTKKGFYYILTTADPITVGSSSLVFSEQPPLSLHADSHKHGGSDEVSTATPGANAIPKAGAGGTLDKDWLPASSTTEKGAVKLATQAEVDTGTDTTRVVTPETLTNFSGLGGGADMFGPWTANDTIFPSVKPAGASSRNSHPILSFDDGVVETDENVVFSGSLSRDYSGGDVIVDIDSVAETAIAGDFVLGVEIEHIAPGGTDIDLDSFDTQQIETDTTSVTSGVVTRTSITLTNAEADEWAAGDAFRLRLTRKSSLGGDTMSDDLQVLRIVGRQ